MTAKVGRRVSPSCIFDWLVEFWGAEGASVVGMTVHVTNVAEPVAANVDALPIPARTARRGIYRNGLKRLLDAALVLLAAPFVFPVLALIALIVSLDGHSPIFRQERVGKDGRRFTIFKFRTMQHDAEDMLEQHLRSDPSARAEWDAKQKLAKDPRCTRFGRLLRRSSMDELPQIVNVLIGDMSLVGPRPMMPEQQSLYPGRSYYNLRPGMTGSWQVSQRNEAEFADRAHYDDQYDSELSFWTDVKILARTLTVVLRGTGY